MKKQYPQVAFNDILLVILLICFIMDKDIKSLDIVEDSTDGIENGIDGIEKWH
jgi:hypothetical protein